MTLSTELNIEAEGPIESWGGVLTGQNGFCH